MQGISKNKISQLDDKKLRNELAASTEYTNAAKSLFVSVKTLADEIAHKSNSLNQDTPH
jgi:hypothetical protein